MNKKYSNLVNCSNNLKGKSQSTRSIARLTKNALGLHCSVRLLIYCTYVIQKVNKQT